MAGRRTTAKATTGVLSAARALVSTVVGIRRSLLSGLPPMQRSHVEVCSTCAGMAAAFVRSVLTHAPAADPHILTLVKQALNESAASSARAKSRSG